MFLCKFGFNLVINVLYLKHYYKKKYTGNTDDSEFEYLMDFDFTSKEEEEGHQSICIIIKDDLTTCLACLCCNNAAMFWWYVMYTIISGAITYFYFMFGTIAILAMGDMCPGVFVSFGLVLVMFIVYGFLFWCIRIYYKSKTYNYLKTDSDVSLEETEK